MGLIRSLKRLLASPSPRALPPAATAFADSRLPAAHEVFTPTRPIKGRGLVGRRHEVARILRALTQEQAHVILYSERGRGKTSVVNAVVQTLRADGHLVVRHTCEAGSTFESIMRGLVHELPRASLAMAPLPDEAGHGPRPEGCRAALPAGPLRPRDIASLPQHLVRQELICVVDEFDRIVDRETRTLFADTIKHVSDRAVGVSFMAIGVSDNLEQILGQHPSIQRALVGVHLPLLDDADIAELVADGLRQAAVSFDPSVIECLVMVSRGMPYFAQLLGLRLLQAVRERRGAAATVADLRLALERIGAEAAPRVTALLARLTDHGRDQAMEAALQDVALSPQDRFGCIEIELRDDRVILGKKTLSVAHWNRLCASGVLRPSDLGATPDPADAPEETRRYSFANRGLIHHVLLKTVLDHAWNRRSASPGQRRREMAG